MDQSQAGLRRRKSKLLGTAPLTLCSALLVNFGEKGKFPSFLSIWLWTLSKLRDADHMIIGPLLIGLILYLLLYLKVKESPVNQSDEGEGWSCKCKAVYL